MNFLTILIPFIVLKVNAVSYEDQQVWKVNFTSIQDMRVVREMEDEAMLDIWILKKSFATFRVTPDAVTDIQTILNAHGILHDVVVGNLQELVDTEKLPAPTFNGKQRVFAGNDMSSASFFKSYHTLDEIDGFCTSLETEFSQFVSRFSIGTSFEGREIFGIHVTSPNNATKKQILVHGAIHAREWISTATVLYIADKLLGSYGYDKDATEILDKFVFSVIPVFNVDGFVYTHENDRMWRKNRQNTPFFCKGIDLNRNFAYKFGQGGSSSNPCSEAYMGPSANAAVETALISQYLKSQQPLVYVDFHAFSQLWMFPFSAECGVYPDEYEKWLRISQVATSALADKYSTKYAFGPICDTIYQASGSSVDFAFKTANVKFPFAVELRDTGRYGFILPPRFIVPSGEETYDALIAMINEVIADQKL